MLFMLCFGFDSTSVGVLCAIVVTVASNTLILVLVSSEILSVNRHPLMQDTFQQMINIFWDEKSGAIGVEHHSPLDDEEARCSVLKQKPGSAPSDLAESAEDQQFQPGAEAMGQTEAQNASSDPAEDLWRAEHHRGAEATGHERGVQAQAQAHEEEKGPSLAHIGKVSAL